MVTYPQGILFCLIQSVLWSSLPVLAKLGYHSVSPLFSLAVMNTFAFVAFASLMVWQRRWKELTCYSVWPLIFVNALCNGLVYYAMVFVGTKMSSAGNAAILLLLEAPFAVLLLGGSGRDTVTKQDIMGTTLMIGGAAMVAFPDKWEWNTGDLLLIFACIPPILGNVCSRKARKSVGAVSIMFCRTLIITPCFWLASLTFETVPSSTQFYNALLVLFINGFIVIGVSRLMWIEAIQVIPISKANSLSSIAPFFTLLGAWLVLNEIPGLRQLLALLPMLGGLHILIQSPKTPEIAENTLAE